jgi:hypothetical protein
MVAAGSAYLLAHDNLAGKGGGGYITYGNFYAAPAEYMIGGDNWKQFYLNISKRLEETVKREGDYSYWDPLDGQIGQVYATAVYTMILAMPYHYLPLYQR